VMGHHGKFCSCMSMVWCGVQASEGWQEYQQPSSEVIWSPQKVKKGKGSSLDIAPLTILDSVAFQPWKWQLTGTDCSTAMQASGSP